MLPDDRMLFSAVSWPSKSKHDADRSASLNCIVARFLFRWYISLPKMRVKLFATNNNGLACFLGGKYKSNLFNVSWPCPQIIWILSLQINKVFIRAVLDELISRLQEVLRKSVFWLSVHSVISSISFSIWWYNFQKLNQHLRWMIECRVIVLRKPLSCILPPGFFLQQNFRLLTLLENLCTTECISYQKTVKHQGWCLSVFFCFVLAFALFFFNNEPTLPILYVMRFATKRCCWKLLASLTLCGLHLK